MKRKLASNDRSTKSLGTPGKRRKANRADNIYPRQDSDDIIAVSPSSLKLSPAREPRIIKNTHGKTRSARGNKAQHEDEGESPTPRANKNNSDVTPTKKSRILLRDTLISSGSKKADRSAKKKSRRTLLESQAEDDWAGESTIAYQILNESDGELEDDGTAPSDLQAELQDTVEDSGPASQTESPSKRGRGRPKGSKNKRTPTPEGDIAPEERYFFQNRPGPPQVSNNTLSSLKLLTHEEYYDLIHDYQDPHEDDKAYLFNLHKRSFPQWRFELDESFSVCLYGYGSKRTLVTSFAEYISALNNPPPTVIVVNGYTPKLHIRTVLSTLASAIMSEDPPRLSAQPNEALSLILIHLSKSPPEKPIYLLINSLDAPSLRRAPAISILAHLASSPHVHVLATADTPNFPLAWDSGIRDQFNFVFHDCTTFAPYVAELNIVDDAHDLLGRKGRRLGGREGIAFVLKSLPENARNLYRVLVSEILTALVEGVEGEHGDEDNARKEGAAEGEVGVEHKILYQKAVSEFICSSDMAFRTLLKEFQDHQMVVMRAGRGGEEVLGVPFGREEMEGVLDDLMSDV